MDAAGAFFPLAAPELNAPAETGRGDEAFSSAAFQDSSMAFTPSRSVAPKKSYLVVAPSPRHDQARPKLLNPLILSEFCRRNEQTFR
jgi:hypothetical protein